MSAIAQPWEKPAITIRPAGIPLDFSSAISASIADCDRRRPASVLALGQVGAEDVVPGRHAVAAVERDRDHRRVGKHEADRTDRRQIHFFHDRHEVIAVGAKAMHQQHGGSGLRSGLYFDGMK